MPVLAAEQPVILADTSPFCRFAENGICEIFADYLGDRLRLTPWVVGELEHRAKHPAHRQLEMLARRDPPWTINAPVPLDDAAMRRASDLANGWRRGQQAKSGMARDQRANLGEATTIVAAQSHGYAVLLDDGTPKRFAVAKGLVVMTTEEIAVELAAAGVLRPQPAFLVYTRVYGGGRPAFDTAVEAARAALT
jgi:hypothetical protein